MTRGHRRGLLLPDLEGVDTVFDQIAIAKQKAGIRPDEQVHLERFEVVRHTAGGEPRRLLDSREESLPAAAAGGVVLEDACGHEDLVEGAAALVLDSRQFGCHAARGGMARPIISMRPMFSFLMWKSRSGTWKSPKGRSGVVRLLRSTISIT